MEHENNKEEFIDIWVGKIRMTIPNDMESIMMAKRHIDALHKSFVEDIISLVDDISGRISASQIIETSTDDDPIVTSINDDPIVTSTNNDPIVMAEPIKRKSYKKLPVMIEEKEIKVEEQKEIKVEEQREIVVDPFSESYTTCPLCNGKLKMKATKQSGNEIRQVVLCKNKKCKFQREHVFSI